MHVSIRMNCLMIIFIYLDAMLIIQYYKVDLALWAHHHSYQRTCPIHHQKCRSAGRGPVHVVVGVGGQEISLDLIPYVASSKKFN